MEGGQEELVDYAYSVYYITMVAMGNIFEEGGGGEL